MNQGKKTAAIGKTFSRVLSGAPSQFSKAELKTLWETYLPEQKPSWTVKKDTQVVVAGNDADEAVLTDARSRGLEVVSGASWLGFEEAAGPSSIGDYLRRLIELGYRFDTGCNEGEGTTRVSTVALQPVATAPALSTSDREKLAALQSSPLATDVLNTLVAQAAGTSGAWLGEGAAASTDPWFFPTASTPVLFRAPGRFGGQPDLTALRAKSREGRVIPGEVLEERCRMLGAHTYTLVVTRLQAAPVRDAPKTLLVFGGLEKNGTEVSFATVHVVHT